MMVKIKNDSDLKKKAEAFFGSAWTARCKTQDEANQAFKGAFTHGFRIMEGAVFKTGPKNYNHQRNLVGRCIKLLGPKIGHERDIEELAWKTAAQMQSDDVSASVKYFIESLLELIKAENPFYVPNYAIRFKDDVREIKIGPVLARLTEDVIADMQEREKVWKLKRVKGSDPSFIFENCKATLKPTPICWVVTVNAARKNTQEEALWLIDTALSLLRFSHPIKHDNPFFPSIGDTESHSIIPPKRDTTGFIMSDEVISTDGGSVSQYYQVNKAVADHLQSINFEERAKKIFSPVSKSVGERVAQGLGWMARGRRAHDRAERFLFFYTAIEALLASSDRTAPVIQTIARHAAVILAEKVEKRYEIAKNIKTSYETRSALVHGGRRNVSKTEADDAQLMAEILYLEILEKVDLASSDESFEAGLSIASYGLRWPAENSYRDTDE
jgi:hypothetical protein